MTYSYRVGRKTITQSINPEEVEEDDDVDWLAQVNLEKAFN